MRESSQDDVLKPFQMMRQETIWSLHAGRATRVEGATLVLLRHPPPVSRHISVAVFPVFSHFGGPELPFSCQANHIVRTHVEDVGDVF